MIGRFSGLGQCVCPLTTICLPPFACWTVPLTSIDLSDVPALLNNGEKRILGPSRFIRLILQSVVQSGTNRSLVIPLHEPNFLAKDASFTGTGSLAAAERSVQLWLDKPPVVRVR